VPRYLRIRYTRRPRYWLPPVKHSGATQYELNADGSITPSGALLKQAGKVLAGSVTPSSSKSARSSRAASRPLAP
jgi:hypothetical protein